MTTIRKAIVGGTIKSIPAWQSVVHRTISGLLNRKFASTTGIATGPGSPAKSSSPTAVKSRARRSQSMFRAYQITGQNSSMGNLRDECPIPPSKRQLFTIRRMDRLVPSRRVASLSMTSFRISFARNLLKIEPRFHLVCKRSFLLDSLREPQPLATDPACGVQAVRVRKLKLAPASLGAGLLTIEAPGGTPDTSVYDLANSWFAPRSQVLQKFAVVHATIAIRFHPKPGAKRTKTFNIELTRPHTSNLKDLPEMYRQVAETYLERWKLIEPSG